MKPWSLIDWATAIFLGLCAAAVCIVLGFAWAIRTESPGAMSDLVATAQAERLEQCLDCESELHALQTRIPPVALAAGCTPDATLVYIATNVAPRLADVEQRVGTLEWVQVEVAAILVGGTATNVPTLTPQPSETPRPTPTFEFLPTVTLTSTPEPLCYVCSEANQACPDPANYFCKKCQEGKWRCVRRANPVTDCITCLAAAMSESGSSMTGLAVYHDQQREIASGEPFDAMAMAGAVDVTLFEQLRGHKLRICVIPGYGVNEANCIEIDCNDKGPLTEQGQFVYESRPRGKWTVQRWWSGDGDGALYVICDLTREAMNQLTGGSFETCAITMTIVE